MHLLKTIPIKASTSKLKLRRHLSIIGIITTINLGKLALKKYSQISVKDCISTRRPSRSMLNSNSKMSNQMHSAQSEKQMKINMSAISDRILIRSRQDNGKRNQVLAKTYCRSSTIILESLDLCLHQHCH